MPPPPRAMEGDGRLDEENMLDPVGNCSFIPSFNVFRSAARADAGRMDKLARISNKTLPPVQVAAEN